VVKITKAKAEVIKMIRRLIAPFISVALLFHEPTLKASRCASPWKAKVYVFSLREFRSM